MFEGDGGGGERCGGERGEGREKRMCSILFLKGYNRICYFSLNTDLLYNIKNTIYTYIHTYMYAY